MGKKKNKGTKIKFETSTQTEVKSFLIVVLVVILCVGGIYLITKLFVNKDSSKEAEEPAAVETTVNYDVAIVGNIMNRPYDIYYVAVYSSEGDYSSDMNTLVVSYSNLAKHHHIYTVDLANSLNKDYYDPENENVKAKGVDDFKFGDLTLIKIEKGKVTKYITDYTKMESELKISKN